VPDCWSRDDERKCCYRPNSDYVAAMNKWTADQVAAGKDPCPCPRSGAKVMSGRTSEEWYNEIVSNIASATGESVDSTRQHISARRNALYDDSGPESGPGASDGVADHGWPQFLSALSAPENYEVCEGYEKRKHLYHLFLIHNHCFLQRDAHPGRTYRGSTGAPSGSSGHPGMPTPPLMTTMTNGSDSGMTTMTDRTGSDPGMTTMTDRTGSDPGMTTTGMTDS